MPQWKLDIYVDDTYIKTVFAEGDDQASVERDVLEDVDIILDVEELD
jgi:hypothetical protein